MIICPAAGTLPDLVRRLTAWGIHCVQVMRHVYVKGSDFVAPDFRLGTAMAIDHLVGLGHRNIAFVGGAFPVSVTKERHAAFRHALRRHSLSTDFIYPCSSNFRGGATATQRMFRAGAKATAAICFNDIVAMGVVAGLRDQGIRAGRDFAVVGWDDITEAGVASPALTTVATSPRQIGEEAARLLIRRILDPSGGPERVILPPRLIIRDSCGAGSAESGV